jgi:hypothetical protein
VGYSDVVFWTVTPCSRPGHPDKIITPPAVPCEGYMLNTKVGEVAAQSRRIAI